MRAWYADTANAPRNKPLRRVRPPSRRVLPLKQVYEEQFELAASEDRDRSSVMFVPFNTMMMG